VPHRSKAIEPTGNLPQLDWLTAPETLALFDALSANGTEARFVGGCVRDALSHRPVTDIDIATPDTPDMVMMLLQAAGIRAIPTGIDHGTVTAVINGKSFEITTLRKDIETDGRHAKVVFTDDWAEDATRRDFTINTMSANINGEVFDPFTGMSDLAYGWVRFIGRASDRIEEDHLRILRYYRFYGSFSQPYADKDALVACRAAAPKLKTLSAERIRSELMKILVVNDPAEIAVRMKGDGIFDDILPEAGEVSRLRFVNWFETRAIILDGIEPDPIRHLAALVETDREGARAIAERLRLSNAEADRLADLCAPPVTITPDMGEFAENRSLRQFGPGLVRDLALLTWAEEMAENPRLPRQRKDAWIGLLERCEIWQQPEFPISGRDVIALGIPAGPEVGKLLTRIEDWWENGNYQSDRQACLDQLLKETEGPN